MKIDCYAGGDIATIQLVKLRDGRFEMQVSKFEKNFGAEPFARAIIEAPQLRQLAKEALRLAGETKIADMIPRFKPFWGG